MNEQDPTSAPFGEPAPATQAPNSAWDSTREKASEALHTGEAYVREHPGTSILSIFGLGFLLGLLVGWSLAHEERHDLGRGLRWRW